MKEFIEIPFGAKDSELCGWEYTIPEGYTASIENGKIVVKKEDTDDEDIKSCIAMCLTDANEQRFKDYGTNLKDCLAWLEKQGKNNMGISEATKQKLEDNLNKALEKETPESWNEFLDKQGEQKPTWSDENKKIIDGIIEYLECFNDYDCGDEPYEEYYERFEKYIKFMESLKPQSHWKPSEEHIRYLQAVVNDVHNIGSESCCIALRDLLEQLKKL